jgi:hypothetical protein
MNMKRLIFAVAVMVMSMLMSACGGGNNNNSAGSNSSGSNTSGSPADAVKGFYAALYGGNSVDSYMCTSDKTASDAFKQAASASKSALAASGTTVDVSGLTFTVANQTSDSADVTVAGKLKITVGGNSTDTDFPAQKVKTKNENGWKVCGISQ